MSLLRLGKLLTWQEFDKLNQEAMADGFWNTDIHVFPSGTGWYTPFVWDALNELREGVRKYCLVKNKNELGYLSQYYWDDWSNIRPPISIMGPNGRIWEIDRQANNGAGWRVTGLWPNITCNPSIDLPGYHGWLNNGEFSADVSGRGERGTMAEYTPR